ncbi:hypothetical protein AURDEDRAFT_177414 [Auricularia subglabra TFB-10046 SS5]|uniref:Uncharacterized protein n=1 Tax=Auricularia subglabra (strain TFB-10046 / SS5) TaxID=717982 RepID=J0D477_AURST|nr:hypothetical protein AURDEDRAFT_177414 [Auricularia subglabra TFB-10046 SS5]
MGRSACRYPRSSSARAEVAVLLAVVERTTTATLVRSAQSRVTNIDVKFEAAVIVVQCSVLSVADVLLG